MEIIRCEGLTFTYPKSEYPALSSLSFALPKGAFCLVTGASAAGKSTLLKLMKQEIAPYGARQGTLTVNGTVGYVSQHTEENIICHKVRAELSFALMNRGYDAQKIELLVAEAAAYFHLADKLDREITSLSGGEKQLVNLAAVMITKPDVLVLDEPLSRLDPVAAAHFTQMLQNVHRDFSTTMVVCEHESCELFEIADCYLLLQQGKGTFFDTKAEAAQALKYSILAATVPVYRRLYDGVDSVAACRESLANASLHDWEDTPLPTEKALTAKNVWFAYERGEDVLTALSLTVHKGCIHALLGANGAGKTTLLKILAGVKKPYRGRVHADGKTAMLCQNVFDLFTKDTCREEVPFGDITDFLGIADIADCHPYDISGGQAQRLALAKVLAKEADILLLDEPTKGLDSEAKQKLAQILRRLCEQGKTVLFATHDIEFAGRYCDEASFLANGAVTASAPRKAFFTSLQFYTTALVKITGGLDAAIISVDDLEKAGAACET